MLDSLKAGHVRDTAALIEREYLTHGSSGLKAYASRYAVTGASIATALTAYPERYVHIPSLADRILVQESAIRSGLRNLKVLYADAQFVPIWFFVGDNGPGGLARPEGVLIAAERFSGGTEAVVPFALHEMAHVQQALRQGLDAYRRIFGPEQSLLALALREGSADLMAELATGSHITPEGERYGLGHERDLWIRFRTEMHEREPGDWMFVRPSATDWPPDLGYWLGYRIARSDNERAADKQQAILDILGLTDFRAFLEASGYGDRFR